MVFFQNSLHNHLLNAFWNTSLPPYCCQRLVLTVGRRRLQKRRGSPWAAGNSPRHLPRSHARLPGHSSGSTGCASQGTQWHSCHTHSRNELFLPGINMSKHEGSKWSQSDGREQEESTRFVIFLCWLSPPHLQKLNCKPELILLGDFCIKKFQGTIVRMCLSLI